MLSLTADSLQRIWHLTVSSEEKAIPTDSGSLENWTTNDEALAAGEVLANVVSPVMALPSLVGDILRRTPSEVRVQAAKPGLFVGVVDAEK